MKKCDTKDIQECLKCKKYWKIYSDAETATAYISCMQGDKVFEYKEGNNNEEKRKYNI